MRTALECLPCLLRQALDVSRMLEEEQRRQLLQQLMGELAQGDLTLPPPALAGWINRRLRQISGIPDPYAAAKQEHNRLAASLLPELREQLRHSPEPFRLAVRLAIAGNIIDLGVKSSLPEEEIRRNVQQALSSPFVRLREGFEEETARAQNILYLTDNAGEIFFDRLLLEMLPAGKVTVAVRGEPIINDATREDAEHAGLHEVAEVIDNGSDLPGTVLRECSPQFRARFAQADLIIAKGQGNFESLNDRQENIWFLFMAKCPVVAETLGVRQGTHILSGTRQD